MVSRSPSASTGSKPEIALRVIVVAALVLDAVVHLRLVSGYQAGQPAGIGTGNVFRIASTLAIVAALWVLLRGSRAAYAAAFAVAFSAVVAVVLYRYVDVPQLGPIPPMYEPIWFFEKTLSAVAEGVGAIAAAIGVATTGRRPRRAGTARATA